MTTNMYYGFFLPGFDVMGFTSQAARQLVWSEPRPVHGRLTRKPCKLTVSLLCSLFHKSVTV